MENNDCAQTTQPQDFNPVEAIHREIEQVSSSGLVGMLRIKTANQTILDAATRPNPKDLYHSLWYEGEVCCLFADSNLGKSIYAVQMADEIARDQKILYVLQPRNRLPPPLPRELSQSRDCCRSHKSRELRRKLLHQHRIRRPDSRCKSHHHRQPHLPLQCLRKRRCSRNLHDETHVTEEETRLVSADYRPYPEKEYEQPHHAE